MGRHNKATKEKKAKAREEKEAQAQSRVKTDTTSSNVEAAGIPPAGTGENQVLAVGVTALRPQLEPELKPESVQGKRSVRAQEAAVGDETREGMETKRAEIGKERTNGAAQSVETAVVKLQPSQWEARQRRRIEDTSPSGDKGFDAGSSGQFQRGPYEVEDSRTKGRGGGEGNVYRGGDDYDKRIDALGRLLAQEAAVGDETREGMETERAEIGKERTNGAAQSVKTAVVTLQPSQWEARQRRRIEDTSPSGNKGFDAGSSGQFQRGPYEVEDSRTNLRGGGEGNGYRGGDDYDKRIDALGRLLSSVLRHRAVDLRLKIRSDGYVVVNDLLKLHIKTQAGLPLSSHNVDDINEVVKRDNKQRFGLREEYGLLLIRANQGHSIMAIKSEELLKPISSREEVPVCVHGTYLKHLKSIKKEGLKSMGRLHIHFATGLAKEGGVISGMRSSCEVVIHLDVQKYLEDGLKLYQSENGVILAEGSNGVILPKYFAKVTEIRKKSYKNM